MKSAIETYVCQQIVPILISIRLVVRGHTRKNCILSKKLKNKKEKTLVISLIANVGLWLKETFKTRQLLEICSFPLSFIALGDLIQALPKKCLCTRRAARHFIKTLAYFRPSKVHSTKLLVSGRMRVVHLIIECSLKEHLSLFFRNGSKVFRS